MKRMIVFALAAIFLAGCTPKLPDIKPTDPVPTVPAQQIDPSVSNQIAQQTGGAVHVSALPQGRYFAVYPMGNNVLAVGTDVLAVLPETKEEAPITYQTEILMEQAPVDTAATGVAYYRADTRQVIVLNPQLQKVAQLQLPEDMTGAPVISLARKEVYYANSKELRALHMDTGISRLLRQQNGTEYVLQEACFDGTVLACREAGEVSSRVTYISAETGQTVAFGDGVLKMATYGKQFCAYVLDGSVHQLVFGTDVRNAACLLLAQPDNAAPVLAMNGVVGYGETADRLNLSFYNLNIGKCTAKTALSATDAPVSVCSNGAYVWVLAQNSTANSQLLYRWDIAKSKTEDSMIYTGKFFTPGNPDAEGLEQCRQKADSLEAKYHVELAFWTDAVQYAGSYAVVPEHHPQILTEMLEQLEVAFARFPENFFRQTLDGDKMKISLVRSIDGGNEAVQFRSKGDYRIILSSGGNIIKDFYQCVAYSIDSHVLGNSRDYDNWNKLNPEGFSYTYGEELPNLPQYLEGENRAFTDRMAMDDPCEDRSRIFCNAMLEGNGTMFRSKTMQAKLLQLCKGIREAYGLEKSAQTYAWEQYLETSLAYKK